MSFHLFKDIVFSICFFWNINKSYAAYDTSWTSDISTVSDDTDEINGIAGVVLGVVQALGVSISVIILTFIGIKYMIGSAQEKAEYRKSMIPYLIGAALLFSISAILVAVQKSLT